MRKDRKPVPMFSLREAAARGVERVYSPIWANPLDHIKIDIIDGRMGPWVHVYSPANMVINGRDPVDMLAVPPVNVDAQCMYAYTGPLPDSDEYKGEVAERLSLEATPMTTGSQQS